MASLAVTVAPASTAAASAAASAPPASVLSSLLARQRAGLVGDAGLLTSARRLGCRLGRLNILPRRLRLRADVGFADGAAIAVAVGRVEAGAGFLAAVATTAPPPPSRPTATIALVLGGAQRFRPLLFFAAVRVKAPIHVDGRAFG